MKPLLFFCLIFNVLLLNAQTKTYQFTEDIKDLKADESGLVYIISNQSVCKYQKENLFESCIYTDKNISEVLIVSENEIYVAIDNAILTYLNQEKTNEVFVDEVITALAYDGKSLIIGTLGAGIFKYNPDSKDLLQVEDDDFINDIIVHDKQIYVLNDDGLKVYDLEFNLQSSINLPDDIPKQVEVLQNANLVILTDLSKLIFIGDAMLINHTYQNEDFKIKEISTHKDMLFAIDDKELKEWKGTEFENIETGDFDHLQQIKNLIFTSHKKSFRSYNLLSKVYNIDKTFSIYADADQFWLGREGKISLFQQGKIERDILFPETYKNIYVSSLVKHEGKIYAGTMGRGILIFEAETGNFLGNFHENSASLIEQNVIQISQEGKLLWIGYLNAIKAYDIETRKMVYDFTDILENNYLYRFHINSADDFYLCTSDSGLLHVLNGKAESYLEDNSIYSLAETSKGVIFSAEDNGIYAINDSLQKLSDQFFFRSNSVYNLLSVEGNLLFVNDFGIDMLIQETREIAYLSFNNLNEAHLNAHAVGDSKVLLGYESGIVEFEKDLLEDAYQTKVNLVPPLLFDTPVKTDVTNFDYDENTWTFSFNTINYSSQTDQYYKYRLLPIETEWVSTTQQEITYYNLPPGEFTFEVSSGGHRNFKPQRAEQYRFNILKPVWQSLIFWMVLVCLTGLLIFAFIKYREKQIKKKEELKNIQLEYEYQRLKDQINPHFLFNSFNSIIGIVEEDPKKASIVLEKLSSLFRTILQNETAEVVPLSRELEFTKQYFEIHQLRFQNLISLDIKDITDPKNKFVIPFSLQLLVENAIKHNIINSKHHLHIQITEEQGYIVVSNKINLKKNNKNSLGLGLENLIKRHEMKLKSKPLIIEKDNIYIVKIPYLND
jgi:ligand-binding sensor domain-containing protein